MYKRQAILIAKHLRPQTGVAFIATKRYYFGVGGGSDAFRAELEAMKLRDATFNVEVVQVYDDGASNIRELLKVTSLSPSPIA